MATRTFSNGNSPSTSQGTTSQQQQQNDINLPYTSSLTQKDFIGSFENSGVRKSYVTLPNGQRLKMSRTDAANMANTMYTNYLNYLQAQESNKLNYAMFLEQNEYNSAKAQVQRYKEAGINPYIAMSASNASAGSSGSWNGANYSDAQTSQITDANPTWTGIKQGVDMASNIASTAMMGVNIAKGAQGIKNAKIRNALDNVALNVAQGTQQSQIEEAGNRVQLQRASLTYQNLVNAGYPNLLASQIASNYSSAGLADAQATTESYKRDNLRSMRYLIDSQTQGQNISNKERSYYAARAEEIVDKTLKSMDSSIYNNYAQGRSSLYNAATAREDMQNRYDNAKQANDINFYAIQRNSGLDRMKFGFDKRKFALNYALDASTVDTDNFVKRANSLSNAINSVSTAVNAYGNLKRGNQQYDMYNNPWSFQDVITNFNGKGQKTGSQVHSRRFSR